MNEIDIRVFCDMFEIELLEIVPCILVTGRSQDAIKTGYNMRLTV